MLSYEECLKITKNNNAFYEAKHTVEGCEVSMFDYYIANPTDFKDPLSDGSLNAQDMRGLTYIHTEDGPKRFLHLHKFFNLNQCEDYLLDNLKDYTVTRVQDKLDGSLIRFVRFPNGKIRAKSKMSFESSQAKEAQKLLEEDENLYNFVSDTLDQGLAAIFEYVSPFNRIVVGYKNSELILLQLRDENTGEYLDIYDNELVDKYLVKISEKIDLDTLANFIEKAQVADNTEGWVLSLHKDNDFKMVKIKTKWYFDRHGIMTDSLIRENLIVKMILEKTLDDAISLINDPEDIRVIYAEKIEKVLSSHIKSVTDEVLSIIEDNNGDRSSWSKKYAKHKLLFFAGRNYNNPTREGVIDTYEKYLLKHCYRLENCRVFLRELGVSLEDIQAGDNN